jgi:serine/threonine protein kinase/Tol biopolymer transport system component
VTLQTISHYKVVTKLGEGGMGEVYKAQDTVLERPVALKVLLPSLVRDPDRVRRFVQEAKSASALNHPNIVTIYEIGEAAAELNGSPGPSGNAAEPHSDAPPTHYIAMEFVDGTTLHSKIHRERVPLKRLLEYMSQVADGLAKAHAAGIVHRDLKPENIMITEDGYAKILDFGLAKLVEPIEPAGASPGSSEFAEAATAVMAQTQAGMVMGTVGYMSPEQVQGKPVDQRSDIFSFGCILFEAATTKRPFQGDSLIDSLHKIIYAPASPVGELNPNAPAELQRIIRKSLAKDPGERYQSVKDLSIDLRDLVREYDLLPAISVTYTAGTPAVTPTQPILTSPQATPPHGMAAATGPQPVAATGQVPIPEGTRRGGARNRMPIAAGLAVLAAIAVAALFFGARRHLNGINSRPFQNTKVTKLTSTGKSIAAAISPDGKYLAHVIEEAGQRSLWIRQVAASTNVQIVPPADSIYAGLTFSRDSNYVYFVSRATNSPVAALYQIPALGGPPKKLIEDVDSAISFSPSSKEFVFVRNSNDQDESGIFIANADGSGERKLTSIKFPERYITPQWSPDGKVIACSAQSLVGGYHNTVHEVQVGSGAQKRLTSQRWLSIAGICWMTDGTGLILSAMDQTPGSSQFQIWHLSYPNGSAERITHDLNNYAGISLTADSSGLATVQADANMMIWTAPDGDATRARQVTSGSGKYGQVSWTPAGKLIYVTDAGGTEDIWIMDSDGKNQKQLTSNEAINMMPSVSPDGRYIAFASNRGSNAGVFNIWRADIDGGNPKRLTDAKIDFWPSWSRDGKWVLYTPLSDMTRPVVWKAPSDGGDSVQVCDRVSMSPMTSPDGKLVAACSNDKENPMLNKVAILQYEDGKFVTLLNVNAFRREGGAYRWAPNGKSITYIDNKEGVSNIWSAPLDGTAPKQLTDFKTDQIFSFDWSPDGKQLACSRGVESTDVILLRDLKRSEKP